MRKRRVTSIWYISSGVKKRVSIDIDESTQLKKDLLKLICSKLSLYIEKKSMSARFISRKEF